MEQMSDYLLVSNLWDRVLANSLGLLIALYTYYVEVRKEGNPGYTSICDLGANVSCSRALTSRYARGFGTVSTGSVLNIRNCNLGILFYTSNIVLAFSSHPLAITCQYVGAILSVVASVYLAAILVFVLHNVCVVCFSSYVINIALLYLNHARTA